MTSPMQVLEDTPKVWIVRLSSWHDMHIHGVFRTEASAKNYIASQKPSIRSQLYIDWEVLHD